MKSQKALRTIRRKQRRQLTSVVLFALGSILLLIFGAELFKSNANKVQIEVSGSPALRVDQEKIDLGDVKLGRPVKVSFTLTNVGDQPLTLQKQPYIEVAAGC